MNECDLCGNERNTETLGFDHRDRPDTDDIWRIARVCSECRGEKLMPTLRNLFGDGGLNLSEPGLYDDGWETITPDDRDALFFAFEGSETWHVARSVQRAVPLPDEYRCVGHCGIEHRVEPEPRSAPLSARREGIVVCGRCAQTAPQYVGGRR